MSRRRWYIIGITAATAAALSAVMSLGTGGSAGANTRTNNETGAVTAPSGSVSSSGAITVVHYYSLAASAFAPDGLHNTSLDYFNQWRPPTLFNNDSVRCFNTGLDLPNGALLKSVTVYYHQSVSNRLFFQVIQDSLATDAATVLTSFRSATAPVAGYTRTVVNFPANTKVNTKNAYSSGVCPVGDATFSGLTIAYS
jgi:hypothetical protein